jgi:hypothetical protein
MAGCAAGHAADRIGRRECFLAGLLAAGLVLAAAFVAHIRRHPDPLVAPQLFSVHAFRAGAAGLVAYYTGFATMLLGTTLLLTAQWRFSVLHAAAAITAVAGLATGRRIRVPEVTAMAETAAESAAVAPGASRAGGGQVDC